MFWLVLSLAWHESLSWTSIFVLTWKHHWQKCYKNNTKWIVYKNAYTAYMKKSLRSSLKSSCLHEHVPFVAVLAESRSIAAQGGQYPAILTMHDKLSRYKEFILGLIPKQFFSCRIKAVLKTELYLNFPATCRTSQTKNSKCKQVTDFSTSWKNIIILVRGMRGVSYISYKSVISYLAV